MDTAEARTTPTGEAGGSVYDAFLSYSHATDELLAPRLQVGLQRFAKPWWKRRALHIFRDEASLSANPHLWSSITEALDDSDWFVLLLSPDAAESEWVDREVEYWLDHKDPERFIPVVTDGEFAWSHGSIVSDAAPPALRGAFADEPRWVDLRFAHTEEQLDLKNPRFSAAVADIASAIRGVPKDELESEEVRQHRRTVRTAWAAGIVVVLFALFSAAAALFALDQRNEAQAERDRAVTAEDAATAAAEAEAEQRVIAEQEAAVARSRELAAAALANLEADPERSILLALEAVTTAGATDQVLVEPVTALRQALGASRVVSRIAGGEFVVYTPDGALLATGGVDATIWAADTGQQVHILPSPDGRIAWRGEFSADGRQLAVAYEATGEPGPLVVVWDVATGEMVRTLDGPATVQPNVAFSPAGSMLAVETDGPLLIWDTVSGTEHYRIDHGEGHYAWGPSFSPDGTLLAVVDTSDDPGVPSRVMLYDAGTGAVLDSFEVGELNPQRTVFDPTGRRLAALSQTPAGVMIWDVESRDVVASLRLDGSQVALEWSPDGEVIAVSGNEGIARLFDVETGDEVLALVGHDSLVWSLAFSPDGVHLAGAGLGSDTLVWDVTAAGSRELATLATPYSNFWVQGVRYDADGDSILVTSFEGIDTTVARLDATTGEVLAAIPDQFAEWPVTPILASRAELVASLNADFTAALHDGETFAPVIALPEGQFALAVSPDGTRVLLSSLDLTEAVVAEVGSWEVLMTLENTPVCFGHFSPDGSLLSAYNCVASGNNWVVDVEDASYLATFRSTGDDDLVEWIPAHFSPDGSLLVVRTLTGRVGLVDIAALRAGSGPEEAIVIDIDAHNGAVPDNTPFSPDGSLFATWGIIDGHLRVWKTENGELVADLGETETIFPGFDFHPNGRHLIVAGADGTLRVYTLDPDELVQIAKSRVTRALTEDECATYHIDPCPTLEQDQ